MLNVTTEVKANKLIITIDISKAAVDKAAPSSSGKTKLVGTTGAAVLISGPGVPDDLKLQLSCYVPNK
jgi:hypothetical protein